ncbi:MFS general substrate transporter [Dentipellis sp. KUC8613]|nr:MFS general substrate transporter [Dentipellis sp. KUC8613]
MASEGHSTATVRSREYERDSKSLKEDIDGKDENVVSSEKEVDEGVTADDDFPDGGWRAWMIVVGAVAANISTFGYVNAWGTFQAYYETTLLADTSPSTIAWIGSIQYALVFFPCIVIGRLFDIGYFKSIYMVASVVLVVATFLIAECKTYWQFLLCQGFAVGLASGSIFGPVLSIVSHWFKKRRGIALGITACGSSIGGTIFPIMFRNLQVSIGFKWTMRVFGFILIFTIGVSNIALKRRLPPVNVTGGMFNFRVFKNPAFAYYTLSGFIGFLGLYTVLTYIDASGPSQGVSESYAFYLVAIANASSGFGRIMTGVLADRIGPVNIMMPMMAATAVLTYIWPFVHGTAAVTIIAIVYGFVSGAYVGQCAAPMISLGDTADVGRRVGMYFTTMAFGALAGPPISGAINNATGSYKPVGIYAGTSVMVAVVFMNYSRYLVIKGWLGKV